MVLSAQLSPEQIALRERLQRLLQELNIDSVVAPDAVKHDVIEIVSRRVDAFTVDDNDTGHRTLVEYRIEPWNCISFRQRARQIPYARRKFVETELQRMISLGSISARVPGDCPYASLVVVVPKNDSGLGICVDYRHINQRP